jgi:hypothetical protein
MMKKKIYIVIAIFGRASVKPYKQGNKERVNSYFYSQDPTSTRPLLLRISASLSLAIMFH